MTQDKFNTLTRSDLEQSKFVLDSNWDVAIRILSGSSATFLWLTDTPASFTWQAWKTLRVNAWETALEYTSAGSGSWDIVWPASSVDTRIATFSGTTWKLIQDSWFTIATSVPAWAVFTDTTYSVWDWGLTELNFTKAKNTLLNWAEQTSNKDKANWYAWLDAWSKINPLQLPALAISETFVVASEVAQLALTVQEWDIAVRTDQNKSYIALNNTNATITDWQELLTPTDTVQSVAGKTWVVTITKSDVWLWNVENTALSRWAGTTNITTLWTITSGTWNWTDVSIANGGTWQSTKTGWFNALSPLIRRWDILYHNGTNNVRLAKGTAWQVLTMNTWATAPEWSTPSNSGTGGTTNQTDAYLLNRANHTWTQASSTITWTKDHTFISDYDTELAWTTNTTAFTPTADYHPATKKYVDDNAWWGWWAWWAWKNIFTIRTLI